MARNKGQQAEYVAKVSLQLESQTDLEQRINATLARLAKKNKLQIDTGDARSSLEAIKKTLDDIKTSTTAAGQVRFHLNGVRVAKKDVESLRREYAKLDKVVRDGARKQSLAAQSVVRIVQDAPFGFMGIANNIDQLVEQMGFAIQRAGSVGEAVKGMFRSLFFGPMAIPLVISAITALTLSWDKMAGAIDGARVALGFMTEAEAAYLDMKRKNEAGPDRPSLIAQFIGDLDDDELKKVAEDYQSVTDAIAEAADAQIKLNKLLEDPSNLYTRSVPTGTGGFRVETVESPALTAARKELESLQEDAALAGLIRESAEKALKDVNYRESLKDKHGIEDDEKKAVFDAEAEIAKLRAEAMEEGFRKTLEEIDAQHIQRLNKYKREGQATAEMVAALEAATAQAKVDAITKWDDKIQKELDEQEKERMRKLNRTAQLRLRAELKAEREAQQAKRRQMSAMARQLSADRRFIGFAGALSVASIRPSGNQFADQRRQAEAEDAQNRADFDRREKHLTDMIALNNDDLEAQAEYNTQLDALLQERMLSARQHANLMREIDDDQKQHRLDSLADMLTNMSGALQDIFEENKTAAISGAVLDVFAAGIGIWTSVIQDKSLPWYIKYPLAGSMMASVIGAGMKQVRQIERQQYGQKSGSSYQGFTQRNSVTNARLAGTEATRDSAASALLASAIGATNQRIDRIQVVIDDATSAKVVLGGTKRLQKQRLVR